ncbi:alpha/beta hydrolase [Leptospira koniambonensis]|uniref:Alpha/beta hydrolase n=1 Tax=Leptospira koniambonensis TaxID=2484950 RepID=A0A4R9JEH0_9LEPT|nr:alpha/beta hydrolase [Leptospira koniambonensis]TGL36966.1 alpha/beta hydrolase [Leptospira koniambonensis]
MKPASPMCINFKYILYSILLFFLLGNCSSMLFYPTRDMYIPPEKMGFQPEKISLKMKDGTNIKIWIFKPSKVKAKASILQFHGNGDNMSSHYISLVWLVEKGYELVIWDYRGYGDSEGEAEKEPILEDSKEVLKFQQNRAKELGIPWIIYGQSMGGALAIRAVGEMQNKEGLLLVVGDGTFAYYSHVAKTVAERLFFFPIGQLVGLFFSDHLSPGEVVDQISPVKLLVVHGTDDQIVSYPNGMELFQKAKDPKIFWEIKGGKHLDWMEMGRSKGAKNFQKFLDELVSHWTP